MSFFNSASSDSRANAVIFQYDYWLLGAALVLIGIGLVILASASFTMAEHYYRSSWHFLLHQAIYLVSGVFLAILIVKLPISFWEKTGGYLLILIFLSLVLVLVPGVGKSVNGSMRWIGFGPFTFQPSELTKCGVVIYMAGYLVRRQEEVQQRFSGFLKPVVIVVIMAMLLLVEPDFGAAVVIIGTILGMIFLAGGRLWQFLVLLAVAGTALGGLAISAPYRLLRVTSFLDPWSTQYGSGYQLTQSLIAFGRGGFWGVGLGNGIQKLFYLPEAHTDFLFAILAEELGIIGQLIVISLFTIIITRIMFLGNCAKSRNETFTAFLAYGLGLLLAFEVIINIGVNIGILPTKGLALPFMSYGGSSMLFNCAMLAVLLRISHEMNVK